MFNLHLSFNQLALHLYSKNQHVSTPIIAASTSKSNVPTIEESDNENFTLYIPSSDEDEVINKVDDSSPPEWLDFDRISDYTSQSAPEEDFSLLMPINSKDLSTKMLDFAK